MSNVTLEKTGLFVPMDIADDITLANLKECKSLAEKELEEYADGSWMHPDDVTYNQELILALDKVIHYFGG